MTREQLTEIEQLARAARSKIGFVLYRQILALTAYVRHLEEIRDAAIGLMADGGDQYINRLNDLFDKEEKHQ